MFTSSALATLLVASASVQAASPFSRRMEFCGHQPCLPPNRCQDVDGVSVCMRLEAPTCAGVPCEPGYQCALMQDVCVSLPCHPKPYCVKTNPCGDCASPERFCQLLPTPVCRPVVEPTCDNKVCLDGEICAEVPDNICLSPPCLPKLLCTDAAAWYQVAGSLAEKVKPSADSKAKAEELRLKISGEGGSEKNNSQEDD
ncbi:neurogenic locus notch homolog protein 1-like [Amphibalanus amphitrite]|uniref:neurogenic locus notch homolog protein 1-like n=1 Tax=Amphibalanus amphitrite TaxID=1232801 RepID=UPI001C90E6CC|nr:neurogenic locus notch homolog protein 1-like [Amphibalanus amphitrite]